MTTETNRRRSLSAICLMLLSLLLVMNSVTRVMVRGAGSTPAAIAITGFLTPLWVMLTIVAAFTASQLLRDRADRTGLLGAALASTGIIIGGRIMLLGQLEALLDYGVPGVAQDTLTRMFAFAPIVWKSIVPVGLLYPIGMTILGIALLITRPIPRWIATLWIAGAILFPIGRAVRVLWAIHASDLIFAIVFFTMGMMMRRRVAA